MRSEDEVREQLEFIQGQLDSEEMRHDRVRLLLTHYRRALGWVLEEEHLYYRNVSAKIIEPLHGGTFK